MLPPHLSYHITPLLAIAGYIAYPKEFRINPSLLYFLSIIHNGLLVAFNAWTFVTLSQILYNNGIVFQSNYYFQNPQFDKVIYLFYISKYYEFIDTFLLYLNGKSPIFLQKYHHIGAVICWHLCYVYKVDAIWISSFCNSFVHIIMYSYYLGCLLKINQVLFIKKYITSLQISQLLCGHYHILVKYRPPVETYFGYFIILIFDFYVWGLIFMFSVFYYRNYITKKIE
jgi:hypothetical protein